MKIKNCNNKLKTAVMASVLALALINSAPALAYNNYHLHEYDFNSNFQIHLGGEGSTNNGHSRTDYYLYWCANDTTFYDEIDGSPTTIKGGNWYIRTYTEVDGGGQEDESAHFYLVGNGGMSEDELQQAIDDAIHNVEGDMTVDGSQDITGDQTVDGSLSIHGRISCAVYRAVVAAHTGAVFLINIFNRFSCTPF